MAITGRLLWWTTTCVSIFCLGVVSCSHHKNAQLSLINVISNVTKLDIAIDNVTVVTDLKFGHVEIVNVSLPFSHKPELAVYSSDPQRELLYAGELVSWHSLQPEESYLYSFTPGEANGSAIPTLFESCIPSNHEKAAKVRVLNLAEGLNQQDPSVDWKDQHNHYYYVLTTPYLTPTAAQLTDISYYEFRLQIKQGKVYSILPFVMANLTGDSCYTVTLLGELTSSTFKGILLKDV